MMIFAFPISSPPVATMRNGSPGPGFLGKTNKVLTGWYSSGVLISLTESDNPDGASSLFEAGESPHDVMQLNIKGKIRPKINERVLIPAFVFLIGIFDLKITEIIKQPEFIPGMMC
jgi:hypothetical protein